MTAEYPTLLWATRLGVGGWVNKNDYSVVPNNPGPDTFTNEEAKEAIRILEEFGYKVQHRPALKRVGA